MASFSLSLLSSSWLILPEGVVVSLPNFAWAPNSQKYYKKNRGLPLHYAIFGAHNEVAFSKGDSADMCGRKFPLMLMGGRAQGQVCADGERGPPSA
jgi:hypothetical protein